MAHVLLPVPKHGDKSLVDAGGGEFIDREKTVIDTLPDVHVVNQVVVVGEDAQQLFLGDGATRELVLDERDGVVGLADALAEGFHCYCIILHIVFLLCGHWLKAFSTTAFHPFRKPLERSRMVATMPCARRVDKRQ